ncbi:hypothetical protein HYV73_02520 [Candidatus Uhrbacteria bacterium]|nr:hypothetical protein [Candidatus Uhrbacteria bacterium]
MSPKVQSRKIAVHKAAPRKAAHKRVDDIETFDTPRPPLRMYRIIAAVFVLAVLALLAVVLYVSSVQATIFVKANSTPVEKEFVLDIVRTPSSPSEVRGRVLSAAMGRTKTVALSGTGMTEVPAVSKGKVVLVNESAQPQPLVATTRLLTADRLLFRIDQSVTVPAKGRLEVPAHADKEGKEGDIGPTRFTIPGLAADRQKVVYAVSESPFTGGTVQKVAVGQADIDTAVAALQAELEGQAKETLNREAGEVFDGKLYSTSVIDQKVTAKPGDEVSQFDVVLSVRVVGVYYDKKVVQEIAVRQLYERLTQGSDFVSIDQAGMAVAMDRFDAATEMANLHIKIRGQSIPSTTSAALDPGRFIGMTEAEVRKSLLDDGVAQDARVEFYPSFVHRVPQLRDRVFVVIE